MINISLNSKNRKTKGTIEVRGDSECITNEIYVILRTLSEQSQENFYAAVNKHTQDLMRRELNERQRTD